MSGTFPTAGFTAMELQTNTRSRLTESVSGQTQRIKSGAQYWSFKLKSPPLSRSDFNAIYSFIVQQDGQVEAFTVVPPVISSTTGTAAGTVTVADVNTVDPLMGTSAGSSSVGVSGGTGTLKKGDLIKFSNHNKVYMLTSDLDIDGSGNGSFTIEPGLVASVADDETIVYGDVQFTVRLNSDIQEFRAANGDQVRYEIDLTEDI